MKKLFRFHFLLLISFLFLVSACGGRESKKIPLDQLEGKYKRMGEVIVKDFFDLVKDREGLFEFQKKEYVTPKVHAGIAHPNGYYADAPKIIKNELGEVYSYKLVEAIDKGILTTLRYQVNCEKRKNEFVELKLDMNENHDVARIYLYVYADDTKKKRINLF